MKERKEDNKKKIKKYDLTWNISLPSTHTARHCHDSLHSPPSPLDSKPAPCLILSHPISSHIILLYLISSYLIPSYILLSHPIYLISFYLILPPPIIPSHSISPCLTLSPPFILLPIFSYLSLCPNLSPPSYLTQSSLSSYLISSYPISSSLLMSHPISPYLIPPNFVQFPSVEVGARKSNSRVALPPRGGRILLRGEEDAGELHGRTPEGPPGQRRGTAKGGRVF